MAPSLAGMTHGVTDIALRPASLPRPDGKRVFDLVLVALLAPVWVPLLGMLIALVRTLQGPGVFYLQSRLGRHGRTFRIIKLRTMVRDADAQMAHLLCDAHQAADWDRRAKLTGDPRCTRLGRVLRRYSLDELPQLLNVLRGDMGLIGPRPVPLAEFRRHYTGDSAAAYLQFRPGIGGLWQVSGRNALGYDDRLALDRHYAATQSLRQDTRILLRSLAEVFRGTGC